MKKKKEERTWDELSLVLINGDKIKLVIRDDVFDEIWEGIMLSMATNSLWFSGDFIPEAFEAHYLGSVLAYIDFKKVLGIEA